jgi:hypothetical protein
MFYNHIFHIYHYYRLYEYKKNIKCQKIFNEYKITLLKYNIKLPN